MRCITAMSYKPMLRQGVGFVRVELRLIRNTHMSPLDVGEPEIRPTICGGPHTDVR